MKDNKLLYYLKCLIILMSMKYVFTCVNIILGVHDFFIRVIN